MTTAKHNGFCAMCGRYGRLRTIEHPLCFRCSDWLAGRRDTWIGTCRLCGAENAMFPTRDPICDACASSIRHTNQPNPVDMTDPETRRLIADMRSHTDPMIRTRLRQDLIQHLPTKETP
ncbi:hypothetical protein Uis1B_2108 [Bifidobacterium margollesii]|uniref:Uncharacterized protein n=1 Tax=Bifidobacterium margollesii TaxID=2020964 RepID=A0A2N5J786_9BIFI|nr:hypothetical protein [Bifidobacterium margollesii]PLS30057.1 hypothetical protein Uis1B_2108 [Bifidobacterium margollesii]